jgi:transcriptional regulator with XRE-family HTH domain
MTSVFAKNFRFLREEKDITQTDMGVELGFSRASVDAYEDGRAMPPYPKLKIIADYFEYSIEEITEEKLWNSQETKRNQADQVPIKFEEESTADLRDQLKALNIELREEKTVSNKQQNDPTIALVGKKDFEKYLSNTWNSLESSLKRIMFEMSEQKDYRAFEAGVDFPVKESLIIGSKANILTEIMDGERYLIVSERYGFLYRRVFSQLRTKGILILSGEVEHVEVSEIHIRDIKEVWKIEAFYSKTLPEPNQDISRALKLAKDLSDELRRLNQKD